MAGCRDNSLQIILKLKPVGIPPAQERPFDMRYPPSPPSPPPGAHCSCAAAVALAIITLATGSPAQADDAGVLFEIPIASQRDADFNRVISNGPAVGSTIGSAARSRSIGAIANTISITQSGSGNTIILNAEQTNSGAVVAAESLNGQLSLD